MTGTHAPWFALLESNTTGSGRQFCAAARARGLRPVVLAADPARYPYLDEDRVDAWTLDTADVAAVADACRTLAGQGGLAGVTSSSEYFAATAAEVAAALGLPAPDAACLTRCRHKDQQRLTLARAGVAEPAFRVAGSVEDAARAAHAVGFPVVVKPTAGSGSVGVRLCHDPSEVARHAAALLAATVNERGLPVPGLVLVEEHVPGPEFSVETFDGTVVGVVGKHLGPTPFFVETGHDVPAPAPRSWRAALGDMARRATSALGLGWGAAHTELRVSSRGPVVIEVNPRLAGGMIPTLVRLATGVDLVDAAVARASGSPLVTAGRRLTHACIRFVMVAEPGTVVAIRGLDEARQVTGVRLAEVTAQPGTAVAVTHSFRDRLGYVIATGDDAGTAAGRAEKAASLVLVQTRPAGRRPPATQENRPRRTP